MSKPLFVSIPHHLGKDEATRRLQSGLANARSHFGHMLTVQEETWSGNKSGVPRECAGAGGWRHNRCLRRSRRPASHAAVAAGKAR